MAYWMVACSVYLYIVILGANVRICRWECGIGVAVGVEGVHRVAMTGDAAGVSAVADAGSPVSCVPCAGADLCVPGSIGHDLNAAAKDYGE